jgi:anthranilate/para-aminobenzoate synthase component II
MTETIKFSKDSWLYQADFSQINAAVYNSLCLTETATVKSEWRVTGRTGVGDIHVIENWTNPRAPAIGMQFHPESFMTEDSHKIRDRWYVLMQNFLLQHSNHRAD